MQTTKYLKKAKYLNEFKANFISMTSHQFSAPLTNIKISIELCKMLLNNGMSDGDINRISSLLSDVITDTDRISDLIADILNVNMAEECKIPYHPVLISINAFVMDYMNTEGRKITRDRTVDFKLFPDDAMVFIDVKLMHHVIENIISNAVKYSPDGSAIEVVTKQVSDNILLEINDLGIGIPEQDIPFLFQQFFRSENVGEISGTGLGLSIVKTYVEMANGTVEIQNRLQKGTSLRISLPKV